LRIDSAATCKQKCLKEKLDFRQTCLSLILTQKNSN
jgi:hypothetical protein